MFLSVVITIAVAVAIAAVVGAVGTPVAVRIARPTIWGRSALPMDHTGPAPAPPPSFEPLDLGPDPIQWPSENPWKRTALPELPWPSQTWDDPHFGAHWRDHTDGDAADRAYEAQLEARRARAAEQRKVEQRRNRRREQRDAQEALQEQAVASNEVQRRARQEMRQLRDRATQMTNQVRAQVGDARESAPDRARQAAQQAKQAAIQEAKRQAQQAAPQAAGAAANIPSPAELEQLVGKVGLAGTVQEIMKRTGWDFKTAAQHLARARRGR